MQQNYELEEQVGHLLRRANQRHTGIFAAAMQASDLTPMQFAVLVKVSDEREVSQNALGRLTAMDPATVQGVVKRLVQRKLIEAKPDPHDRRRHLLTLSNKGRKLLQSSIPVAQRISEETLAPLSANQKKQLVRLLGKIS